jgi:hypothetical protein
MATNYMKSTDFRSIVEPILNKEFDGVYDIRSDEWKGFMKEVQGIARNYHEEPVLFGMGAAPEMPEGMPVSYDNGGVMYNARYVFKVFGQAYALTKVLVEDGDHIRIGQIYSQHLAQSLIETKETRCANLLNRAFNTSYLGGDGKALCVADHPSIVGNQSNVLSTAAVLSDTSLKQMMIQMSKAKDFNGKAIRVIPDKLIVSPDNQFNAEVITKSVLQSGTANNDLNAIKSMGLLKGGVVVVTRATSSTAWFVKSGNIPRGLQLVTRRKLDRSMEGDFETDSVRYKATERYREGWTDWKDIYGTSGY